MNGNISKFINTYWKVGLAIIAIAVTFNTLRIAVGANAEDIGDLEAGAIKTNETLQALLIGQAEMQTSLKFIEQYVKE